MNCENFNDRLPEYLEDTLSTADQAAAREHVQKCDACKKALAQHEALAKSIRLSFHRETQRLSLRPETKRNILNALKRPDYPPIAWERIQAFFALLWRHPAWAGTVLLCLVLLISGSRFYLDSTEQSSAQATLKDNRITYDIDIPIQTEMHVYRRENNMVVDAVVTESSVIDASFSENMRSSPSSQPHIN
jgi:predicted anti-sigma-YlaC factor YlaD